MSASGCPDLPLAKGRPQALRKRERKAAVTAQDRAENRTVKARSGGRCECYWSCAGFTTRNLACRCAHRAVGEPHHLISGSGRRNIGKSIVADWKLAVCRECHRDIHEHILVPVDPKSDASSIVYRRVR